MIVLETCQTWKLIQLLSHHSHLILHCDDFASPLPAAVAFYRPSPLISPAKSARVSTFFRKPFEVVEFFSSELVTFWEVLKLSFNFVEFHLFSLTFSTFRDLHVFTSEIWRGCFFRDLWRNELILFLEKSQQMRCRWTSFLLSEASPPLHSTPVHFSAASLIDDQIVINSMLSIKCAMPNQLHHRWSVTEAGKLTRVFTSTRFQPIRETKITSLEHTTDTPISRRKIRLVNDFAECNAFATRSSSHTLKPFSSNTKCNDERDRVTYILIIKIPMQRLNWPNKFGIIINCKPNCDDFNLRIIDSLTRHSMHHLLNSLWIHRKQNWHMSELYMYSVLSEPFSNEGRIVRDYFAHLFGFVFWLLEVELHCSFSRVLSICCFVFLVLVCGVNFCRTIH